MSVKKPAQAYVPTLPVYGKNDTRVTLIENFASNVAVQKLVDVKPD